jgi:lysyl-tRNA synthetase class 2
LTDGGYLQTSPEAAMKKLVADHGHSVFQICPAVRGGESGGRHRVEFQMLEWYRCEQHLNAMMSDTEALLNFLIDYLTDSHELALESVVTQRCAYGALMKQAFNINPHTATVEDLIPLYQAAGLSHLETGEKADYLDALFVSVVEPQLIEPTIVYDYPACQVALAAYRTDDAEDRVADRFELYIGGMEIANAYQELRDADELIARIAANNVVRARQGLEFMPDDVELIEATRNLPVCSGIALGVDRLAMVLLGSEDISAVVPC